MLCNVIDDVTQTHDGLFYTSLNLQNSKSLKSLYRQRDRAFSVWYGHMRELDLQCSTHMWSKSSLDVCGQMFSFDHDGTESLPLIFLKVCFIQASTYRIARV